jgi:hypothetical protein
LESKNLNKKAHKLILPEIDSTGLSFTPEFEIGKEIFNRLVFAGVAFLEVVNLVIVEPFELAKFHEKRSLGIAIDTWRKGTRSYLIELFNGLMESTPCRWKDFLGGIIILSVNLLAILVALITFGICSIWQRWKTVATSLRQLASKRVNRISSCLALIFVGLLHLHLNELVDFRLFCVCLF